jgi:hypothetical protein
MAHLTRADIDSRMDWPRVVRDISFLISDAMAAVEHAEIPSLHQLRALQSVPFTAISTNQIGIGEIGE